MRAKPSIRLTAVGQHQAAVTAGGPFTGQVYIDNLPAGGTLSGFGINGTATLWGNAGMGGALGSEKAPTIGYCRDFEIYYFRYGTLDILEDAVWSAIDGVGPYTLAGTATYFIPVV